MYAKNTAVAVVIMLYEIKDDLSVPTLLAASSE